MKLLSETVHTKSPKCLLTLPPNGWKPESGILRRPRLFAPECLCFRSGICYTIWLTWALAMVCPSYLAISKGVGRGNVQAPNFRSSDSESNAATEFAAMTTTDCLPEVT